MNNTVVLGGELEQIKIDGFPELINILDGEAGIIVPAEGSISLDITTDGDAELLSVLDGQALIVTTIREGAYPVYTGATEITPSQEEQVLETADKSVLGNIVVKPIPNNYGLITWNGSNLTVS